MNSRLLSQPLCRLCCTSEGMSKTTSKDHTTPGYPPTGWCSVQFWTPNARVNMGSGGGGVEGSKIFGFGGIFELPVSLGALCIHVGTLRTYSFGWATEGNCNEFPHYPSILYGTMPSTRFPHWQSCSMLWGLEGAHCQA